MTKNEMETFRHQLLKLERHLRGDVDTLTDEAFHETDGKAMDNLSNVPVEYGAEIASDDFCEETTIGLFENASAVWGRSTLPLSASTKGSSVVVKSAARKSQGNDSRPFPLHAVLPARSQGTKE